jgi:hypothetical protein
MKLNQKNSEIKYFQIITSSKEADFSPFQNVEESAWL